VAGLWLVGYEGTGLALYHTVTRLGAVRPNTSRRSITDWPVLSQPEMSLVAAPDHLSKMRKVSASPPVLSQPVHNGLACVIAVGDEPSGSTRSPI
jgi:hypothetical protein